jgi:two-component sensor histidine kinase
MFSKENNFGFALFCPHCKAVIKRDIDPEKYAINSGEEFKLILDSLNKSDEQKKNDIIKDIKLYRCSSPRLICPQSAEAIICKSETDTIEYLKKISSYCWLPPRAFRLYKGHYQSRYDGYFGIVFNALSIPRQKNIELEQIINTHILSRLLLGIGVEIEGPLTVYSANIFFPKNNKPVVHWLPVEGYSKEGELLAPPHYNEFCKISREIIIKQLIREFNLNSVGIDNCPISYSINGMCAGKQAACIRKDWNRCPAFINRRSESCPCYASDINAIEKVIKRWTSFLENRSDACCYRCNANLQEIAFPIEVHNHLLGVALSGQVFNTKNEIINIDKHVKKWNLLKGYEEELNTAINKELAPKKRDEPIFMIDNASFSNRVKKLKDNCEIISKHINSLYNYFRSRIEMAFRNEVLGFIGNHKVEFDFYTNSIMHILYRMRVFWAFKASYLFKYSLDTNKILLLGQSNKEETLHSFDLLDTIEFRQEYIAPHPTPLLYRRGEYHNYKYNSFIYSILSMFEKALDNPDIGIPIGDIYFFTIIPASREVYIFIFAARDQNNVSHFECLNPGSISELCQDSILETCSQIVYEFADLQRTSEQNWQEYSALTAHRIGNEINSVDMLMNVLAEDILKDPKWSEKDKEINVMQRCIRRSKEMLTMLAKLSAEIKPILRATNVFELFERSSMGALPKSATLTINGVASNKNIIVDPDLMEQVFRELFVNAIRIIGTNTQITISMSEDKNKYYISICDNGPGIAEEDYKRVFMPFVTLSSGRTGLGLTIVKRIIEAHGGTIEIVKGAVGANFIIILPK